jgi:hypothetical protein
MNGFRDKWFPVAGHRRRTKGFTLVETTIACGLMSVGSALMVGVFIICGQTLREAHWECRLRSQAAHFLEVALGHVTMAYENAPAQLAYRFQINAGEWRITFYLPDDNNNGTPEQYVIERSGNGSGSQLTLTKNGATQLTLNNVLDFQVTGRQQNGLVAMTLTLGHTVNLGARGDVTKQFTVVGRALPRNHGRIVLE